MKKIFYYLPLLFLCFSANEVEAQSLAYDFETYDTTPYYFKYGNEGDCDDIDYKPRWCYSHEEVENPLVDDVNPSATVLKFSTQEARNYGIKFRFGSTIDIDDLEQIKFKIYQPSNVIGKEIDTDYATQSATSQNLNVKVLSYFNAVCDVRQEEGILLYMTKQSFTEEGSWQEITINFAPSSYTSQLYKFDDDGVVGMAIIPTYDSATTLLEESPYVCYIDDIEINPSNNDATYQTTVSETAIYYKENNLCINTATEGVQQLSVIDISGSTRFTTTIEQGATTLPLTLERGVYFVVLQDAQATYCQKIAVVN